MFLPDMLQAQQVLFVFGELALSYAKTVLRLSAGDIYVVLVPAEDGSISLA